jgi:hypothetical protein
MAKYNVIFTVKDKYGKEKEVNGGSIEVDLDTFSEKELDIIEEALPLEDYLKKSEVDTELDHLATDVEVDHAVKNTDSIRYADFEFQEGGQ